MPQQRAKLHTRSQFEAELQKRIQSQERQYLQWLESRRKRSEAGDSERSKEENSQPYRPKKGDSPD
jgi:hypothetical protein